jgi:hypothetical protein
LAEQAEATLCEMSDWEVLTSAQLGVITFCYAPPRLMLEELKARNRRLVDDTIADGSEINRCALLNEVPVEQLLA